MKVFVQSAADKLTCKLLVAAINILAITTNFLQFWSIFIVEYPIELHLSHKDPNLLSAL